MVDIITITQLIFQLNKMFDTKNNIFPGQSPGFNWSVKSQLGVDLIATNHRKIVGGGIKEEFIKKSLSNFRSRRTRGSQTAIDLYKGLL